MLVLLFIFFTVIGWFIWYAGETSQCSECGGVIKNVGGTKKFVCTSCGATQ